MAQHACHIGQALKKYFQDMERLAIKFVAESTFGPFVRMLGKNCSCLLYIAEKGCFRTEPKPVLPLSMEASRHAKSKWIGCLE